MDETLAVDERPAVHRVQRKLLLNVWRKSRKNSAKIQLNSEALSTKVSQLQMQVFSLSQLLHGEIGRAARTNSLIQAVMLRYDKKVDDLLDADMENAALLRAVDLFDRRYYLLSAKYRNCKNDYKTTRHECIVYEKQLGKEREKIWSLRKENELLNAKVREYEEALSLKEMRMLELESKVGALESDLMTQTQLLSAAEEGTDRALSTFKALREQHQQLSARVQGTFEEREQLELKVEQLERAIYELQCR